MMPVMIDATNNTFCDIASAACDLSRHIFKVGCVIIRGGKVLSLGINQVKTHPILIKRHYNRTLVDKLHAEIFAILRAKTDLRGAKIYVARKKDSGKFGNSRPCDNCLSMIIEAGIKKIFYTNENGDWVMERI